MALAKARDASLPQQLAACSSNGRLTSYFYDGRRWHRPRALCLNNWRHSSPLSQTREAESRSARHSGLASRSHRTSNAEDAQEIRSADQDLRGLRAALHPAQEVGAGPGERYPLLGPLPQRRETGSPECAGMTRLRFLMGVS